MHRHAGGRQIVVTDRIHAHDGEEPPQPRELLRPSDADRAMALDADEIESAGAAQPRLQRRIARQRFAIDLADDARHLLIARHLVAIHLRHRRGEDRADRIGGNMGLGHVGLLEIDRPKDHTSKTTPCASGRALE